MTVKVRPAATDYDALYKSLVDSITPGSQFIRAPDSGTDQSLVLPYTYNQTSPFIIEGIVGERVEIYINNKLALRTVLTLNQTEVGLQLSLGRNMILVKTRSEEYLLQVAATYYATFLKSWAQQFFNNIQVKVDDTERQLNSRFSLKAIEHQLSFQDLLPPTRVFRTLAGKLAIRALISETGTTRGVNDIATAACNTTPVVIPTEVHLSKYEPSVYTLYDRSHDFGGHEFNIWLPNITAASWAAFIKLADNLDDDIIKLTSVSDAKVSFDYFGQPETHLFDFEDPSADIVSIITRLLDCFFSVSVGVELLMEADLAFCAWAPLGDIQVDSTLGISILDSGSELDEGSLLDSIDDSDPLTDGWLGASLSPTLDTGNPLGVVLQATLFEDLECAFEPFTTLLASSLLDIDIPITTSLHVNVVVDGSDFGWILGESQLDITTLLG